MWIDSRNCPETFHDIVQRDEAWVVLHGDGEICEECEFGKSKEENDDHD